jgi:anti-anti-sigma factor
MAEMEIVDQQGAHVRVALKGRLDTAGVGHLEQQFSATVSRADRPAIVDFAGVTFLSSMGMRLLVSAAKDLSRRGLKMVILAPQGLVRESITSAALHRLIPVAESEDAATALLAR